MNREYAIIFDLDGTLLDTLGDLTDSVNFAMAQFGYPQHSEAFVRSVVGNGARNLIKGTVPQGTEEEKIDEVLSVYRSYYQTHSQVKTKPYEGVCAALQQLQQKYSVAIVSNKPDADVKALAQVHFPGVYALGEKSDLPRKPAPDMIIDTMKRLGSTKGIYVGDSEVDIITANNSGMPCISVLWGFRDKDLLERYGGNCFCEDPNCLPEIVETLFCE